MVLLDTTENTKPTDKMAKCSQRLVAELRHLTPVSYRRLKVNCVAILHQILGHPFIVKRGTISHLKATNIRSGGL